MEKKWILLKNVWIKARSACGRQGVNRLAWGLPAQAPKRPVPGTSFVNWFGVSKTTFCIWLCLLVPSRYTTWRVNTLLCRKLPWAGNYMGQWPFLANSIRGSYLEVGRKKETKPFSLESVILAFEFLRRNINKCLIFYKWQGPGKQWLVGETGGNRPPCSLHKHCVPVLSWQSILWSPNSTEQGSNSHCNSAPPSFS